MPTELLQKTLQMFLLKRHCSLILLGHLLVMVNGAVFFPGKLNHSESVCPLLQGSLCKGSSSPLVLVTPLPNTRPALSRFTGHCGGEFTAGYEMLGYFSNKQHRQANRQIWFQWNTPRVSLTCTSTVILYQQSKLLINEALGVHHGNLSLKAAQD